MKFSRANKFLSFFTAEWQKKLISVLLAAFLWYYVQSTTTAEQTFNLPIQFVNLPPELVVVETSDTSVPLVVKGKSDTLRSLNAAKTIKPVVYLDGSKPGTNSYKIELTLNEPQPDLIINLQKDRVRLRVDRITGRTVEIQPKVNGTPKDGYAVGEISLDRREAIVQGPSEILAALEYLETQPVDVTGATNDVIRTVGFAPPRLVTVIGTDRATVTVRIEHREKMPETNRAPAEP